ncbi:exonuclease V, beta chain [Candidatus Blochmanniella floridana]|uniref:RecBCD enzyme subunit RecB n=1 Tax=Blochmanniella floridana TaxID=203907 RepID=Q7VRE9_BLOFL|nr:exonuclease V, beta chain [Candidatus Blochmannia floridanus]
MQNLDILYLPLHGIRLIEAPAGTGKTYNLIIIYLRLLLNLGTQTAFSKPLSTKNILIVTFTKTAVHNLKNRIKENIRQFRLDCIQGYSTNPIFSKLLSQIYDINLSINLLRIAEKEINQSAIFTIHGFCQKILVENTIELNMLFDLTIIENKLVPYQKICSDFWRRNFYKLPLNIIQLIQTFWKNPEELLKDIIPYIYNDLTTIQHSKFIDQSHKNISTYYANIIDCIDSIKKEWNTKIQQHDLIKIIYIHNKPNHRKKYNKKNLDRWIEIINQWSIQPTSNHTIPNELKQFRSSVLIINKNNQNFQKLFLFDLIEQLYRRIESFQLLILHMVMDDFQHNLYNMHYTRSQITFDDLVKLLLYNGFKNKNNKLIKNILEQYPVTIIDEFQDTDQNQYKIFHTLYNTHTDQKKCLILIGDPKQAIYGFRGANIFTYMQIRQSLHYKYYLNINWRSSPGMVNAINQLFQVPNPFVFKDISFIPSIPSYKNNKHQFLIHNQLQSPLCFWLYSHECITMNNYKTIMAQECSIVLQNLLYNIHNKTAWLENNICKKKILQTSDIAILVRNHSEASLIRSELLKRNIPTTFLSSRRNIFETIESYELLLLIRAILFPKLDTICTALTTIFFKFNATDVENIHNNTFRWEQIFKEFSEYYLIWKNNNILSMIKKILFRYKIPETLLSNPSEKNSLINILHLGELLNDFSKQCHSKHSLMQWLEYNIYYPQNQNQSAEHHKLRFNDDHHLIKISTIHQSKGLEFPITYLPFISCYTNTKRFSNNQKILQSTPYANLLQSSSTLDFFDLERLSEDLRLLYVAITRSIYHCSIGIAPIIYKSRHKNTLHTTDLHHSALGYLIQNKKPNTPQELKQCLQKLSISSNKNITFRIISKISKKSKLYCNCTKTINITNQTKSLHAKKWQKPILWKTYNNIWRYTSYSELKKNIITDSSSTEYLNIQNIFDFNFDDYINNKKTPSNLLTAHTFPKGKVCGMFFHDLFKFLNFRKTINTRSLQTHMERYNINLNWTIPLQKWIYTIINTPINSDYLTLSKIIPENTQTELKFSLCIKNTLTPHKLDKLCKYYDPLSLRAPILNFETVTGILHGFIDLIFYWKNKYYLLDYKTNWLGNNNNFYTQTMIEKNMIQYRYELQYQLYTIALHRFLQHKIQSYTYEKNFGGVYYLFIRGMNGLSFNNGIYFCRPSWEFIKTLDYFISKKN